MIAPSWTLQSGNFFTMTSNTAPSPFTASLLTSATSGSAWQVFDNASATGITANYYGATTLGLGARILFGSSIRVSKLKVRGDRSGQSTWTCTVRGVKEDDSTVIIYQGSIASGSEVTINSTDTTTPFKGVDCFVDTRTDLICNIYSCQVTEWYSK